MYSREIRSNVYRELNQRFRQSGETASVVEFDSILMHRPGSITKIPMQKWKEEVFLLRQFQAVGIPTAEVLSTDQVSTTIGMLPAFTMKRIEGVQNIIQSGNHFMNTAYYDFLKDILTKLRQVHFNGFGAITITENGSIETQYSSESQLLSAVINRTEQRTSLFNHELSDLRVKAAQLENSPFAVLTHADILNNVLGTSDGTAFYLVDPQTNVSAANKYWDMTMYLIYANMFGCINGLRKFFEDFSIDDPARFLLTAKINAYERASYYLTYKPDHYPAILPYLTGLQEGNILIGNETISIDMKEN